VPTLGVVRCDAIAHLEARDLLADLDHLAARASEAGT
jgi:hypothetical protein